MRVRGGLGGTARAAHARTHTRPPAHAAVADSVEAANADLRRASAELSSATHLVLLLLRLRFGLDDDTCAMLESHLSPEVEDSAEQVRGDRVRDRTRARTPTHAPAPCRAGRSARTRP